MTTKKDRAIDHYMKRLKRAENYLAIALDPRTEEMTARRVAGIYGEHIKVVQSVRTRMGIAGYRGKRVGRRYVTALDRKFAEWGR